MQKQKQNEIRQPSVEQDVSLRNMNTLQVEATASRYVEVSNASQLEFLFENGELKPGEYWVLGAGSNILFGERIEELVIKNNIRFMEVVNENQKKVQVKAGAGNDWHQLVVNCVNKDWGGIENLALIPGTVGAAPIQNIGAYGVELKDLFISLEAFDTVEGTFQTFSPEECGFGYRDSVFKREHKGRFIITSVTLSLDKSPHEIQSDYTSLKDWLKRNKIKNPGIKDIFEGVIQIRTDKLPSPDDIGNAGSFFKNPVIPVSKFQVLEKKYPSIPSYKIDDSLIKVPAGWLIEMTGWKGKRVGNVGTYENQALVIVNHGGATGREIWQLANQIRASVKKEFGIELTPEVNIIGFLDE